MKQLANFITFLLLTIANIAFSQNWNTSTPYGGRINDLVFVNPSTGFACGQGAGTGNCTGTGMIMKTIDGGLNWTRTQTVTNSEINKIQFINSFVGWALGQTSTIMKTIDGGVTWVQQSFGVGAGLNDIHFVDANTGFICGQNGLLRRSLNGGATFTTIASGVTSTIYGVQFVTPQIGYFVSDDGFIRKSTNGGTSFFSVYIGSDAFRDLHFASPDTGWILSPYKILKTTNGGSSFTTWIPPVGTIMTRLHFVNKNLGFIIGDLGQIFKTTDGGNTWISLVTNTNQFIRSIAFTDENTGYFGMDLGRIFKTIDGGKVWKSNYCGLYDQLTSVRFKNSSIGVTVGRFGEIFRTTNGGLNWTNQNNNVVYPNLETVRWINDKSVIAAGYPNVLIKSDDEGVTWYDWNIPVRDSIFDIQVLDSLSIFMTYGTGNVMKTLDGGITWDTSSHTFSSSPLTGVWFLNKDTGYVCSSNSVYRTYTGGNFWSLKRDSISQNVSFNDIQFTSRDTGYVAGTFGQLYRTINGGEWWKGLYPSSTTNAEINEMQFFTNDSGYFAGIYSQRVTNNAAVNLYTLPTACLTSSSTTNSIHILNNGFGYSVPSFKTYQKDSLIRTYLQDTIYCAGSKIFVGYLAAGFLLSTQTFTIQLSDALGNFSNPTNIGTFQQFTPMPNPSGIVTCDLPTNLNGTGFRVRIVSTTPAIIGPDNGYDITIQNSITPTVFIQQLNQTNCSNETMQFQALSSGTGFNPTYNWSLDQQIIDWNSPILNIDTLIGAHSISVSMISSAVCASSIANDSLSFNVNLAPIVNAGIDSSICYGTSITIGAIGNGAGLIWIPSFTLNNDTLETPLATPLVTQQYIVTKNDSNNCKIQDTVLITVKDIPDLNVSGLDFICNGDSTTLTAITTSINASIQWLPSTILDVDTGTIVNAYPLNSTTVYASIIDTNFCTNSDSIVINIFPIPTAPILMIDSGNLVVTGNTQNLVWFKDGILLVGVTNDTLFLPANGTYMVMIIDSNGCSAFSQAIDYTISSVQNIKSKNQLVYTSNGNLLIEGFDAVLKVVELEIYDLNGRIVLKDDLSINEFGKSSISIINLQKGIYIARLVTNGETLVQKVQIL